MNFLVALLCLGATGQPLPVNNAQVLFWEANTSNQYLDRGHVLGFVGANYGDRNGHIHFQIVMQGAGTIEAVYNNEFGALPQIKKGMAVEACGDYITSNAPTGSYQASPDGAIIHWIHRSNGNHLSGYLRLDNQIFGQ